MAQHQIAMMAIAAPMISALAQPVVSIPPIACLAMTGMLVHRMIPALMGLARGAYLLTVTTIMPALMIRVIQLQVV